MPLQAAVCSPCLLCSFLLSLLFPTHHCFPVPCHQSPSPEAPHAPGGAQTSQGLCRPVSGQSQRGTWAFEGAGRDKTLLVGARPASRCFPPQHWELLAWHCLPRARITKGQVPSRTAGGHGTKLSSCREHLTPCALAESASTIP